MHIRNVIQVLSEISGRKIVHWKTLRQQGRFDMDNEFVLNMSVTRLAKTWNLGHQDTNLHMKIEQLSTKPIEDVGFVTEKVYEYKITHNEIICVSQTCVKDDS